MAEFSGKPLGILDRIYRFVGSLRGVNTMELGTPIQLVHDVSRQAELGVQVTPDDGYFALQWQAVHAAANTQTTNVDAYSSAALTVGGIQTNLDFIFWILGFGAHRTTVNAHVSTVALNYPSNWPGTAYPATATSRLVGFHNGAGQLIYTAGGAVLTGWTNLANVTPPQEIPYPVRVPRGSSIGFHSVSAGINTVTHTLYCWAGPRGAGPPGMA